MARTKIATFHRLAYRTCDSLGVYSLHHARLFGLVHVVRLGECLQYRKECEAKWFLLRYNELSKNVTREELDPCSSNAWKDGASRFSRSPRKVVIVLESYALPNLPNGTLATSGWS